MPQQRSLTQRDLPPWLPALIAVVVIGLVIALIGGVDLWPGGGDEASPTSTTTSTTSTSTTSTTVPPEPVDAAALMVEPIAAEIPSAYRVTYDVVQTETASTEEVVVRRPYESISVTRDQAGVVSTGDATSLTNLYFYLSQDEAWLPLEGQKHRAEADTRPLGGLATMIELGLVSEEGTANYAGRDCTVYLTGSTLSAPVAPAADDETTELCVDDAGLVLHERWQQAGSVLLERTATSVEIDPAVDPAQFDPTPVLEDLEQFEGVLAQAEPATEEQLAGALTDVTAPEGYVADGAVVRIGAGGTRLVRFHVNGIDLIEHVESGEVPDADLSIGGARPVEIDGVGEAWFVPGFSASTLRVRVGETGMMELTGPYPNQLVEMLQTMTVRETAG